MKKIYIFLILIFTTICLSACSGVEHNSSNNYIRGDYNHLIVTKSLNGVYSNPYFNFETYDIISECETLEEFIVKNDFKLFSFYIEDNHVNIEFDNIYTRYNSLMFLRNCNVNFIEIFDDYFNIYTCSLSYYDTLTSVVSETDEWDYYICWTKGTLNSEEVYDMSNMHMSDFVWSLAGEPTYYRLNESVRDRVFHNIPIDEIDITLELELYQSYKGYYYYNEVEKDNTFYQFNSVTLNIRKEE